MLIYVFLNGVEIHWVRISTLFGDDQHLAYINTFIADPKLPDVVILIIVYQNFYKIVQEFDILYIDHITVFIPLFTYCAVRAPNEPGQLGSSHESSRAELSRVGKFSDSSRVTSRS